MIFDALWAEPIRDGDLENVILETSLSRSPTLKALSKHLRSGRARIIWMPEPPKPKLPELIQGERL